MKKFVIVIPSYNNSHYCLDNLRSVLAQDYEHFRVIFINDASTDDTREKVEAHLQFRPGDALVNNPVRRGALCNIYHAAHSCADGEVIVVLDGDDRLAHANVLTKVNEVYSSGEVWMTYGQYSNSTGGVGVAKRIPDEVIAGNSVRRYDWCASHLRTFSAWLFKKIRKEDLMRDGEFFAMAGDLATMFPMLEMAGSRSRYVDDVLCVYNLDNPLNDHKVDNALQRDLDAQIRAMRAYEPLSRP